MVAEVREGGKAVSRLPAGQGQGGTGAAGQKMKSSGGSRTLLSAWRSVKGVGPGQGQGQDREGSCPQRPLLWREPLALP